MPNGKYVLNDLDFENTIKDMDDRELALFTARLSYSNAIKITSLENRGKRTMGSIGAAGALLGGAFVGGLDYLLKHRW